MALNETTLAPFRKAVRIANDRWDRAGLAYVGSALWTEHGPAITRDIEEQGRVYGEDRLDKRALAILIAWRDVNDALDALTEAILDQRPDDH